MECIAHSFLFYEVMAAHELHDQQTYSSVSRNIRKFKVFYIILRNTSMLYGICNYKLCFIIFGCFFHLRQTTKQHRWSQVQRVWNQSPDRDDSKYF